MYTWGYIKECTLMKLDLTEEEATAHNLLNRFPFYANEAMTQICSTVKPNRTFVTVNVTDLNIRNEYRMPDDFVSFGDDVNMIEYDNGYGDIINREAFSDDFVFVGYNKIKFLRTGKFTISYNARWITFSTKMDNRVQLDVPMDVLDCLPSYIAHQCYKIDDEYKSSVFRNEYETMLARLDNTDYKSPKSIQIGGDW